MTQLKLHKLPERTPVKIAISLSPELDRALAAYARAYNEVHGTHETVRDLVPAMLASFIGSDRAFARWQRKGESL